MKRRVGPLCAIIAFAQIHAADTQWKAGLAAIKITPEVPVPMAGYAIAGRNSQPSTVRLLPSGSSVQI